MGRAAGRADEGATFVLVGGVPGAGKSTALAWVSGLRPGVRVLDSEQARRGLRARVPRRVPYAVYRPVVHAWHVWGVVRTVLAGPSGWGSGGIGDGAGALVVHDPATSAARRRWWAWLARRGGWRPVLVMVDVERAEALSGQVARGRVVRSKAFARHWGRWAAQRERLVSVAGGADGGWEQVCVVERAGAAGAVLSVVDGRTLVGAGGRSG
ncbi:ATP-binding protein [Isoptericola sp. 4D.3]|uniref:ATP-binding protein n=1 Tax=Isoptericola peretonis TaxID=2918523 RepID=A0ABT0J2F5_9MICO|nr:ATP-binding protein [Isoptericola sp. 4D.3]